MAKRRSVETSVEVGTYEYVGQCFVEFMPRVQMNGLRKLVDSVTVADKSRLERFHFQNMHVVMEGERALVFTVKGESHEIPRECIALITHPGSMGAFLKHPDYDALCLRP